GSLRGGLRRVLPRRGGAGSPAAGQNSGETPRPFPGYERGKSLHATTHVPGAEAAMNRWLTSTLVFGACLSQSRAAAEPARVLELRTQQVDGTTYFQVRLERPADLRLPAFDTGRPFSEADRRKFAVLPRLVPQDRKTRAVYYRPRPTRPGLTFCGQVAGGGEASLLLLYPAGEAPFDTTKPPTLAGLVRPRLTEEARVTLDFTRARKVPVPAADPDDQHIHRDDL